MGTDGGGPLKQALSDDFKFIFIAKMTETALRIVQIVSELSRRGGVESVAFELQRVWREEKLDARVIACSAEGEAHDVDFVIPRLSRIGTRGRMRYLGRLLVVPAFTIAATHAVLRRSYDTVVLSHGDSFAGDVCVVHAVNNASLMAKLRDGKFLWLLNPMHLWVGLRDNIMIRGLRFRYYAAVSERVKQELRQHFAVPESRIVVIPNGVNIDRFSPDPQDRAATRAELDIDLDVPLLLFVGHEFERKGLNLVIEALSDLGPKARLLVVGAGNTVRARAQADALGLLSRVDFLGPRSDLPRIYRAADAFVFPTLYEAFPLVCMEALACGLPVFATRVGGIEEYLEDGINGFGIERNGAAIAQILQPLIDDRVRLSVLRRGAVATAERYAWPIIAQRYQVLLRQVWQERRVENALSKSVRH